MRKGYIINKEWRRGLRTAIKPVFFTVVGTNDDCTETPIERHEHDDSEHEICSL
jgi:hypothetical protein